MAKNKGLFVEFMIFYDEPQLRIIYIIYFLCQFRMVFFHYFKQPHALLEEREYFTFLFGNAKACVRN